MKILGRMVRMRSAFSALAIGHLFLIFCSPIAAQNLVHWSNTSIEGIKIAQAQVFPVSPGINPDTGEPDIDRDFLWTGIEFDPRHVRWDLVSVSEFLNDNYDGKQLASGTEYRSREDSLLDVWDAAQSVYNNPIAVVPVGYLETRGFPQVAGFLRLNGEQQNPLMSAKNLTAVLCSHSEEFRIEKSGPEGQNVPYLFKVNYDNRIPYRYTNDFSLVELRENSNSGRIERFFIGCEDAVQVGPYVAFPRMQEPVSETGPPTRRSSDVDVFEAQPEAFRTVLVYSLSGKISVITTLNKTKLEEIWELISSDGYYNSSCNNGAGDPDELSIGCEYWAVVLTSFEHSGIIFRNAFDSEETSVRNTRSVIPTALVFRTN